MRRSLTLAVLALLLTQTSSAYGQTTGLSADYGTSVWASRPLAIEAHLGAGSPYGMAGLALDISPLSWLSLNIGGGAGLDGAQVAGMARFRLPLGPLAPTLSLGTSFGSFKEYGGFFETVRKSVDGAMWINGDLGLEYRWSTGVRLRAFGGMGQTTRAIDCRVEDGGYASSQCDGRGIEKVYGGMAFAYAF
jgi:hypothetical protein